MFQTPIDFEEDKIQHLVFENPADMGRMISEIRAQIDGFEGSFYLSQGEAELDMSEICLIVDPFSLNANSRDILTGFIKKLVIELNEPDYQLETDRMISSIQSHLLEVAMELEHSVTLEGIDIRNLCKSVGIEFETGENFTENFCEFIRLASRYEKISLFVVVNLSSFVSEEEYAEMVKQLRYLQIPILLVDGRVMPSAESVKIFDPDFCEIDSNSDAIGF